MHSRDYVGDFEKLFLNKSTSETEVGEAFNKIPEGLKIDAIILLYKKPHIRPDFKGKIIKDYISE